MHLLLEIESPKIIFKKHYSTLIDDLLNMQNKVTLNPFDMDVATIMAIMGVGMLSTMAFGTMTASIIYLIRRNRILENSFELVTQPRRRRFQSRVETNEPSHGVDSLGYISELRESEPSVITPNESEISTIRASITESYSDEPASTTSTMTHKRD